MSWVDCQDCETEFRVISDSDDLVEFCPYCGGSVETEETEDAEEDD